MVAYALRNLETFRSAVTLRNEVINYLNTNAILPDGFPMELFSGIPWIQYLNEILGLEPSLDTLLKGRVSIMLFWKPNSTQ